MKRAIIVVLDSLGIGATSDAANYGDVGADTLGHIADGCASGAGDRVGLRQGALAIPHLQRWGLASAAAGSRGAPLKLASPDISPPEGAYGHASEISSGKDTPSGHWEICGAPVLFDWGVFPKEANCFPQEFMERLQAEGAIEGTLANCHASGTEIIKAFGEQHLTTNWPICYTSADSVFQIAAHEQHFGLDRLYQLCQLAKKLLEPLNIARVIARPFDGDSAQTFQRTANRRDFTTEPLTNTLLDHIQHAGGSVISIGKIADIFAHKGITKTVKAANNMSLVDRLLEQMDCVSSGLIFVNLVDFDSLFGHRRDLPGYADALEQFDARLPEIESKLTQDDLVLITADHGCDPTWPGSDHTREHVPVIFFGSMVQAINLGERSSFADMGQTIAHHLQIDPLEYGNVCDIL